MLLKTIISLGYKFFIESLVVLWNYLVPNLETYVFNWNYFIPN